MISALLIGLAGSLHCIGMCAPLQMAFIGKQNVLNYILYHFGRILAYALLGILVGFVQESINLFGAQQYISIVSGVLIIAFLFFKRVQSSVESFFSKTVFYKTVINSFAKLKEKNTAFIIMLKGLLNGFLPCGLVYVALIAALNTENWWSSSIYMVMFGLGTVPLLLISNLLFKKLNFKKAKLARNLIVTFIALLFILRGLGLGIPYLSPVIAEKANGTEEVQCH